MFYRPRNKIKELPPINTAEKNNTDFINSMIEEINPDNRNSQIKINISGK